MGDVHGTRISGQAIGAGRDRPSSRNKAANFGHQFTEKQTPILEGCSGRTVIAELAKSALRENGKRGALNSDQQTIQADFHDRYDSPTEQNNYPSGLGSRLKGGKNMTTTKQSWIVPPGFFIKEEMEERGWSQRDLAFILGIPEQAVNMIVSGKRGISPDMAQALGAAFDVNPDLFANLQKTYDMAQAQTPDPGVSVRARMQNKYPVREMIKRGWIELSDATMLETQLVRFFEVPTADEIPYMAHAAKKSGYEKRDIPAAQLAWLFRVRQIARSISTPKYSERALLDALKELQRLLAAPEDTRHIPRILAECGVRFVLVEKLPTADIDGVCFWLDEHSPVIGMSTRRDKIDNFWFVLRHEIEHVLNQDGQKEEIIDVDLEGSQSASLSKEERIANDAAADFCAPTDKLVNFIQRKKPFFYEKDVIAFARLHNRHPGLVVGQMQRRLNRYDYLTRHLVKVRQFVLPGAIADGWGQVIPVSL
jgi:HTH-type transcriptional regulator/antitoxin HigA